MASSAPHDTDVSNVNTSIAAPNKGRLHALDLDAPPAGASNSASASPTGVNDERLLLLQNNDEGDKEEEEERTFLPIIPIDIQQRAIHMYYHVQDFVQDTKENFVLDRKAITTMVLSFLASVLGFIGVTIASIGGLAVVSCPIWLPIALLTLPLWLPLMLFTSPVWVTATATLVGCGLSTCALVLSIIFFFTWPADWLPAKESSDLVAWYLQQRDAATMKIAKLQAKVFLYAAGVGPAADAVFLIMDKVDVQALMRKVQSVDWKEVGKQVKNGELHQVQKVFFEIAASLIQ